MNDITCILAQKILDVINLGLVHLVKPDIVLKDVKELDKVKLQKLKANMNIEGIILDIDDTVRKNMRDIPKCNEEWIEILRGELKVVILSNGKDERLIEFFRNKDIDYISFAQKPLKKNFIRACKQMDLQPEKVLVIGDDVFCDIFGGKRNNMKTALVKEVII